MRLFVVVIALALMGLPAAAEVDCIADGSPELLEGSQSWCDLGIFEKVHAEQDEAGKVFKAYVVFNDAGMAKWELDHNMYFNVFGPIVGDFGFQGLDIVVEFRRGGYILGKCWTDMEEEIVNCEVDKGLSL